MAKEPYATTKQLKKTEVVLRGEVKGVEQRLRSEIKETERTLHGEIKESERTLRAEMKELRGETQSNHNQVMTLLDVLAKTTQDTNAELKALTGLYHNDEKRITKNEKTIAKLQEV